jgi:hypothetical protein
MRSAFACKGLILVGQIWGWGKSRVDPLLICNDPEYFRWVLFH